MAVATLPRGTTPSCTSGGDDRSIHVYALSPRAAASSANDHPPPTLLDETHVIGGGQHLHPFQSMALSPDGTMLAAADVRNVCVYSTSGGFPAIVRRGRWCFHSQRVGCLAWSPDRTVLASGVSLWCPNARTRRVQYRFAHRGGITSQNRDCLACSKEKSINGPFTVQASPESTPRLRPGIVIA
jgi:WD40 repeat protein